MEFTVEFYEKSEGNYPAEEFINSLDVKMRAKVYRSIMLLEEFGNELRMPFFEYISDGIFELRTKQGSDITRVLYFFYVGNKIILTNGFIKKSNKIPDVELKLAIKYKNDYLNRGVK